MLFHSQLFVLGFLPAVLVLFYAAARWEAAREWVMVVASAVFYGCWDARFVPLLLGQTLATWALARLYRRRPASWIVGAGVAANLAILGYFKYADFFLDSLSVLLGTALPRNDVLLPIGISFFTFELISYLIDLRRGRVPAYPLRGFCLFVFFFPHLVAGPIVRHNELIPQLADDPLRPGFAERFAKGLSLFILGFAKKVFLADPLALMADPVFAAAGGGGPGGSPGVVKAWSGALAFSFQLYFDFSAYTEMALGTALLFGIRLPVNFDAPYRAASVREFWRRWHMTLSRYLRDYLYIPLGGSRAGFARYALATMVTMGLCGLWHGAAWTFVVWGLAHGIGLLVCHLWEGLRRPLPRPAAWAMTMLFVVAGWVLFRSPDFATAWTMLSAMAGAGGPAAEWSGGLERPWLMAAAAAVAVVGPTSLAFVEDLLRPRRIVAAAFAVLAVVCLLEVGKGQPVSFIYFQF